MTTPGPTPTSDPLEGYSPELRELYEKAEDGDAAA